MHQHDLGELVKRALVRSGCEPSLIRQLDHHATIQIDLIDAPALYVGRMGEQVVIWSDLCEFYDGILRRNSDALLHELMSGFPYSRNQQLVLRESDGQLQVYADVASECLDDVAAMSEALNAFFESQTRLLEIIRQ
ncbi:hypothetical protein [Solimicrobium silvestre]|uniref:Invasion protein B family n=1 Tax=Solimicrobium silvestre TaxID=2099400 RepID=A0A2S9H1K4_9BURK|nr:hypothetical protein [Solimicrobium silvestre]PRC93859.1 Invasion protein B family [Solimicrobium silvestre]